MTSNWKQPEPTKAYAVYMDGAWYGEGDTAKLAWNDTHRNLAPQHSREGAAVYARVRQYGRARETLAGHEARCVSNYVSEGLGEF